MASYAPLFALSATHAYFDGGPCSSLALVLAPASARLARSAGLIVKHRPGEATMFYDRDRLDALELYAADLVDPFELVFHASASDPVFHSYTDLGTSPNGGLLCFDSRSISLVTVRAGQMTHSVDF